MTLEPATLDFGAVVAGESAVRSFALTSTGTLPFASFVTIPSGGDVGAFGVEHDGCSLQQLTTGTPCDVAVRFSPPSSGAYAATLLMIGGDGDPAIVPLKGSGLEAPAASGGDPGAASGDPSAASGGDSGPASGDPSAASGGASAHVAAAHARRVVGVAFARGGRPARVAAGRVELGRARCAGAPRCRVVVRSRVYALVGSSAQAARRRARMTSARGDVVLWRLRTAGRRVRVAIPPGLHGRPALLVARLRTHAPGRRTSTRLVAVRLAPAGDAGTAARR